VFRFGRQCPILSWTFRNFICPSLPPPTKRTVVTGHIYQPEESINVWWWSGIWCGLQITFSFSLPFQNRTFRRSVSISDTVISRAIRANPRNDWRRQGKNPLHSGSDPANVRFQINPRNLDLNPGSLWFRQSNLEGKAHLRYDMIRQCVFKMQ